MRLVGQTSRYRSFAQPGGAAEGGASRFDSGAKREHRPGCVLLWTGARRSSRDVRFRSLVFGSGLSPERRIKRRSPSNSGVESVL